MEHSNGMAPRTQTLAAAHFGAQMRALMLVSINVCACAKSTTQTITNDLDRRREAAAQQRALHEQKEREEAGRRKEADTSARSAADRAQELIAAAHKLPLGPARRPALEDALSASQDALRSAQQASTNDSGVKIQSAKIQLEIELVACLDKPATDLVDLCKGGSREAMKWSECIETIAILFTEGATIESDDTKADAILAKASAFVVTAARKGRASLEHVMARIHDESARREVARYTRTSTAVAVVEVVGYAGRQQWCQAATVRRKLIEGGVASGRVLVSSTAGTGSRVAAGGTEIRVRPAGREESIVDADTACSQFPSVRGTKWLNPQYLKDEHDAALRSVPREAETARSALRAGRFVEAKEAIDLLAPVRGENPEVDALSAELSSACESAGKDPARIGRLADLAVCAQPIRLLIGRIEIAGQACNCGNEFEAKECKDRRRLATEQLHDPNLFIAELDGSAINLGTYDFKAHRFTLSIPSPTMITAFSDSCEPAMPNECRGGAFAWQLPSDKNAIRLAAAAPSKTLWTGTISVSDLDEARALKERPESLKVRLILMVKNMNVKQRQDQKATSVQQQAIRELAKARARRENAPMLAEIKEREGCIRAAKTAYQDAVANVTVARLEVVVGAKPEPLLVWRP